ncbi:MAG: ATP synthase F1 subunit epsilon [Thermoanaerobaculia bacterium]|nr:ATP synthase F1 subunit epsilon [Thermoanaerobaculia bacterium]
MAELPTKLHFTLVTREKKVLEQDVDEVVLPAMRGAIGVLPGHTPLLAMLKVGEMSYRVGDKHFMMVLTWGFAEILPDRVIVIAEGAMKAEEIGAEQFEKMKMDAERELMSLVSHDEEFARAEAKLDQSIAKGLSGIKH